GDTGSVTATIHGGGLAEELSVRLVRAGEADVIATNVVASERGFSLLATFDLVDKPRGAWDIVVTNGSGVSVNLPEAFTIEQGRGSTVWVDVVGPSASRVGRPTTLYILYGNTGNVDTDVSALFLRVPKSVIWNLAGGLEIVGPFETDREVTFAAVMSEVAPGIPVAIPLTITPTQTVPFQIFAWPASRNRLEQINVR